MIYLMRHGQDDETCIGGWSNGHLIEEGRLQVYDSAAWIKDNLKINKIITSDITRAVESAEIVGEELNLGFVKDSSLREQNKGLLNGMDKEEARKLYKNYTGTSVEIDTTYPKGESLEELYRRVRVYLDKLLIHEDNTLIITHRGFINMLYYILNRIPLDMNKERFDVTPASIHELDKKKLKIRKVK